MRRPAIPKIISRITFWASTLLAAGALYAGTQLSTTFMGVRMENLRIGGTYDVEAITGRKFLVKNHSDKPMTVQIIPEPAMSSMLLAGYAPMPDIRWLRADPDVLVIPPGGTGSARLWLTIPDDPALRGKKLQGALWIRTKAKTQISVGLRVKLPFTIASSKK